jgi:hypothetical protein
MIKARKKPPDGEIGRLEATKSLTQKLSARGR